MKTLRFIPPAIAAAVLAGSVPALAQTEATVSADVTISSVLYVDIDKTTVSFPSPNGNDYETGFVDAQLADNDATLTHKSNVAHSVYISTTSQYFDAVNPANDNVKPASHLTWQKNNAGGFSGIVFTADPTTAGAVVAGAPRGTGTAEIDYRLTLDYATDTPDTYTLDFVYTIVAD